jgi:hypothetical protein
MLELNVFLGCIIPIEFMFESKASGPIPIACANFSAWYENSIQLDNVKSTTRINRELIILKVKQTFKK